MILSIYIENFRSIKEPLSIDLIPTALRGYKDNLGKIGKNRYLKTGVIYGPNASGKSNILRAVKAIEYLVNFSGEYKPGEKIEPYEPFKLCPECSVKPTRIGIDFIAKDRIKYSYHIGYDKESFTKEELYYYPKNQKTLLFSREKNLPIKFGEAYRGGQKTIEKQLLENQSFLAKAAINNSVSVKSVFLYFMESLAVYPFLEVYRENSLLNRLYASRISDNKHAVFADRFNKLICALDTGIEKITSEEVEWEKYKFPANMTENVRKKIQENFKYNIKTYHKSFEDENRHVIFDIEDESAGTQSLLFMAGLILDALDEGSVIIVDEFEKNLHPVITQYLIKLFQNPVTNPNNAQLIFATHDITQLNNQVFRRDQIWFTEKDEKGATTVFRCSEIKGLRLNAPIDKWYSTGRLGATPIINDLDFLLSMQTKN